MPPKKKPDPPPPSLLAEIFAEFPNVEAAERRLHAGALPASLPIRLKDEPSEAVDPTGSKRKWYVRWINSAMPGRLHAITSGYAYVLVDWDELQHQDQIADRFQGLDTHVRRGDQGKDILAKLPLAYYKQIKQAEQERAEARNSPKAIKAQLQEEAALRLGADAAEGVGGLIGDVREVSASALRESD